METIVKIAELKAADTKSLNQIIDSLENAGYIVVRDKEYECYAYVCVKNMFLESFF